MTGRRRVVLPEARAKIKASLLATNESRKGPRYLPDVDGCWIWQRSTNGYGYPNSNHRQGIFQDHRGPYPRELRLHHHCGVRACVNPEHQEPLSREAHKLLHRGLRSAGFKDKSVADRIALSTRLIEEGTLAVTEHDLA